MTVRADLLPGDVYFLTNGWYQSSHKPVPFVMDSVSGTGRTLTPFGPIILSNAKPPLRRYVMGKRITRLLGVAAAAVLAVAGAAPAQGTGKGHGSYYEPPTRYSQYPQLRVTPV